MASISKVLPLLIIILGVGAVGFVLSLGRAKVGGDWDRDKIVFLAKLWGAIVLAFLIVAAIA